VNSKQAIPILSRRDWIIIAAALISAGFYVLIMYLKNGSTGFPLDDAWIHQTYGRNVARTGHWEYVPGIPSAGSTAPLYTVLLAIGYFFHLPFFAYTYALGAVTLAIGGLFAARLADQLCETMFPKVKHGGVWTGLAFVTAWHMVWSAVSGMETIVFCTLALALTFVAWRESKLDPSALRIPRVFVLRGALFGVIGAALIATRPEGIVLIAVLGLGMFITRPKTATSNLIAWCIGAALGVCIGVLPYAVLNLSLNGQLLPNTFSAKQAEYAELLLQPVYVNLMALVSQIMAGGEIALVPGYLWLLTRLLRRVNLQKSAIFLALPLWSMIHIFLYTLRLPAYYQHGRYMIPALLPVIIFGVTGTLALLVELRRRSMLTRVLTQAVTVTAFTLFFTFLLYGSFIFAGDVKMVNSDMVAASNWIKQNIPNDQLLAAHDIGAIGYFAPRPLFDLAGLIAPDVIPIILDHPALMQMMEAKGVRYLMVLPSQLPTKPNDPRLCELFNAHGEMGGMAVYELAWSGKCPE
jgi:hypothetical protein